MSRPTERDPGPTKEKVRRPYHTPHLVVYGPAKELTAGGTSQQNEGKVSTEANKERP